jgi:hypothetical protein
MKHNYPLEMQERVLSLVSEGLSITAASREACREYGYPYEDSIRRHFSNHINKVNETTENITYTDTNQYGTDTQLSARKPDGTLMDIQEYCIWYGIPFEQARTYKLVTHTGTPYYNIASNVLSQESYVSEEELKSLIEEGLENVKLTLKTNVTGSNSVGIVKLADLHLGAYVDNLIRTKNFSIDILANKLYDAATEVNKRKYSVVHIHILGDLIESFTGLSHKNTWKGLDKAMVGAEAVKLVVKILHDNFLSRINNLGDVKVVAGNHDRVTSDNKEDVQGGAANLVCWGLELIGYRIEFNPLVITHVVDGICHILTHGHHNISKKSTKQICWDYGVQGMYNLICEGHLHSIIQKLNVNQRDSYQTIKDDAVDHRRINCPSFFTGNFFSESLGYTSESGFIITENNGKGVPNVFYYAI